MDPQMSWHSHHAQLHDHYDQPEQPLSTRLPVTHLSIEQLQAIVHAQKKFGMRDSTAWSDAALGLDTGRGSSVKKRKADDEPVQRIPKLPRRNTKTRQTQTAQSWSPDVTMHDATPYSRDNNAQTWEGMRPVSPATANALMQPFLTDLGWVLQF